MADHSSTFNPYATRTIDTPMFHMMVKPMLPVLRPLLGGIYQLRWLLSRPLEIRLLPKWIPIIPITVIRAIPFVTAGELLMTIPLLIILLLGYNLTFVAPNLDESGTIASFAIYAAFLTANKANSIFSFLFGISFERMIPIHWLASVLAVVLGVFHTYVAFVHGDSSGDSGDGGESRDLFIQQDDGFFNQQDDQRFLSADSAFALTGNNPDLIKFLQDGGTNTSGTLLMLALTGLVVLSIVPWIRRWFFDIWLFLHIALAVCVIVFCLMHEVGAVVVVAVWWAVDVALRYLVMAGCRYPTTATLRKLPTNDVVEISFRKPESFDYNSGQFVQIAIPSLSVLQFHPISISSAPHEEYVTLHIRALGGWTKKLVALAEKRQAQGHNTTEITVFVEGPYGSASIDIDNEERYKTVLLVSGGIGVTHCQSVGKGLLHEKAMGRSLRKVRFVWTVRDLSLAEEIPPLASNESHHHHHASPSNLVVSNVGRGSSAFDNNRTPGRLVHDSDSHDSETGLNIANGLVPSVSTDIANIDIYCSRNSDGRKAFIDTPLACNLHNKRPDLDSILESLKKEAIENGESSVAVFGCGPSGLINSLKNACRKHSDPVIGCGGVVFDVHTEIFEF